jgi:hypothetical protein
VHEGEDAGVSTTIEASAESGDEWVDGSVDRAKAIVADHLLAPVASARSETYCANGMTSRLPVGACAVVF